MRTHFVQLVNEKRQDLIEKSNNEQDWKKELSFPFRSYPIIPSYMRSVHIVYDDSVIQYSKNGYELSIYNI
jgi:hypothetical protein